MPSLDDNTKEPAYWRSLDELADAPQFRRFLERAFPEPASTGLGSPSRRQFLRLMGASMALAGLAGCRWPKENIAPFASRPPGRTPGKALQFATAMERCGSAQGLLVTSFDGRPIKIEGNPLHPINAGATDAFAQASLLEMYDPDRSREPMRREPSPDGGRAAQTWEAFAAFAKAHFAGLQSRGGSGLCILSEATSSPSVADLRRRLAAAMPEARWFVYEPFSERHARLGSAMAFGKPYRTQYAMDRADVIACLDADVLMTHPAAVKHARDWAAGRQVDRHGMRLDGGGEMNRLYVVESGYSVTGSAADHRLAARPSRIAAILAALAGELIRRGLELPDEAAALKTVAGGLAQNGPEAAFVERLAADLLAAKGRGLLAVGATQPPDVIALAHLLNAALGNVGTTVAYTPEPEDETAAAAGGGTTTSHNPADEPEEIAALVAEMDAGRVDTLLILGGNPVFSAPSDLEFAKRLAATPTSIHLSLYDDETSRACSWHLPRAHSLESWGDARAWDGTVSIVQPLIEPLHGGKSVIELLAMITGDEKTSGYDVARRTFGQTSDADWNKALHDGLVTGSAWPKQTPAAKTGDWLSRLVNRLSRPAAERRDALEIAFAPDSHVFDGRFANNGWLQEMPDPITKLTWDNAALLSPATAQRLGVDRGDVVRLASAHRSLEIPVFVLPGHADDCVTLTLGHGRQAAGRVGDGTGFNTYCLRLTQTMGFATDVAIEKTGRRYELVSTQDHQAMDTAVGRRETAKRVPILVREATVEHYKAPPDFAQHAVHHPPLKSLFAETTPTHGEHRWAMAIDLSLCTGCGACLVACQAENNVPVVGKKEVGRGREMHWLRIDRYFGGEPATPRIVHQPVACHQCENAPCEQVCPVAATVHSAEGLNDMVYNRCIGTRYCSNNCPYKVRRFNWFNNHRNLTEVEKLAFNPGVTVRSRGVMEKCTYCVQRIAAVKIMAKNERRAIRDGEIVPACAQACPTRAIVFGDLSDPGSRASALHAADRAYAMLAELNIKPRTKYLAKLRNPGEA